MCSVYTDMEKRLYCIISWYIMCDRVDSICVELILHQVIGDGLM